MFPKHITLDQSKSHITWHTGSCDDVHVFMRFRAKNVHPKTQIQTSCIQHYKMAKSTVNWSDDMVYKLAEVWEEIGIKKIVYWYHCINVPSPY